MNENGSTRLDRIEHALELLIDDHVQFREEHKQLLTAQILLTERMRELAEAQKATDERMRELAKDTDERLNALIAVVDGIVRDQRPPQQQ